MSEGAGAALSATSGRGLLPLCGGVGPPGVGVFSSPQLQICGLSSVAVEGLGAVLSDGGKGPDDEPADGDEGGVVLLGDANVVQIQLRFLATLHKDGGGLSPLAYAESTCN